MISGKWGTFLAVMVAITIPLEKLTYASLVPADLFLVLMMVSVWPILLRRNVKVYFPLAFAMWVIFVGSLIATLSAVDIPSATIAMLQEVYLYVAFLTLANAFVGEKERRAFQIAWVIVAALEGVLLLSGRGGVGPDFATSVVGRGDNLEDIGRAVGTFQNANAAGGYMLISFFVALALPWPKNRWLKAGLLAAHLGGIVGTGSNAALAGWGLGLAVFILYWLLQKGRALLGVVGLGTVVVGTALVFLYLLWPAIAPALNASSSESPLFAYLRLADKLGKRQVLWEDGWRILEKYPLGIGPSVSRTLIDIGLHSDYVAFMVERGPLGIIGLALLVSEPVLWLALTHRRCRTPDQLWATGALFAGLLSVLSFATSHEVTHGRSVWMLLIVIFTHYTLLIPALAPRVKKLTASVQATLGRA